MTRTTLISMAMALGAGAAHAETLSERIQSDLESQGYRNVEISQNDRLFEAEAMRGNQEVELVYDGGTGKLLSHDDERRTGLERVEHVAGKEPPANGQGSHGDDDDSEGDHEEDRASNEHGGDPGDRDPDSAREKDESRD